jgi:hypothetical protein
MGPAPEALQIAQRVVAQDHDVPAAPPVPAVGSALRDMGFPAEAHAAVAAGAGLHMDPRAVMEHQAIVTAAGGSARRGYRWALNRP